MEETTNKSGMSTGMIIGIAVIVAIVFGGGTYAYVNNKASKDKEALNAQITELQSQVSSAKTAATTTPSSSTSATTTPSTPTSVAGTEDWKTYTSSSNSYSIKYPKTWVYDSPSVGTLVFRQADGEQWQFQIAVTNTSATLRQAADTEKASKTKDGYTVKSSNVTVGGQSAIQLTLSGTEAVYGDTETLVVYSGKLYTISEGIGTDSNESKMLQTFQFTK